MNNQVVTSGVVLSRTNFGEADRILAVITPDHGKVRLIAKGVRKSTSKLAGGIELFSVSHITFIKGKGGIDTLISTRLVKHYANIVKNLDRTQLGYEILKLISRSTEDNAGEEYYGLLVSTLGALNDESIGLGLLRLWLYMQLLKLSGHSPNLSTDKAGQKLQADKPYYFDVEQMGFAGHAAGKYKDKHIKLLRLALAVEDPQKLARVKDTDNYLPLCLEATLSMARYYLRT